MPAPLDVSRAHGKCVINANNMDTGKKIVPSGPPTLLSQCQPTSNKDKEINDKYIFSSDFSQSFWQQNSDSLEEFLSQVQYFETLEVCCNSSFKGVKGRLAKHVDFWKKIGANNFVIETIKNGYVIPFLEPPDSMFMNNNKSAIKDPEFVDSAVADLLESGCAYEVPFKPFVVNPLSVATQKSGKKRLILDLSVLNKHVKKEKFKFEDWRLAVQFFQKDCFSFKFDLRQGYHHFDVCPQQQTYLGFSWKNKFYCFSVLVFGLASSPYLFSKCLRAMVKFWRQNAINIVLYLDDGFGMASSYAHCERDSEFVKKSLIDAGFLINEEKSIFNPVQKLEWLGIVWNSVEFSLSIPERRISDLLRSIDEILKIFPNVTARQLAQVTGKIISLSPVYGNLTRLMTRYCYMSIETRSSWDKKLFFHFHYEVFQELKFWRENVRNRNLKSLKSYSPTSVIIYSDASNFACGAYTVKLKSKIFHKMWNENEKLASSTWREMKAIEQALISFKNEIKGTNIKWYTDNQNCLHIVKSGSMKEDLQKISFSIFSICTENCISIDIQWIPRSDNSKADYISKMVDHEDWGISCEFFEFIDKLWGPHSVDRFASVMNHKTVRFNSLFWNPNSEAVDAFTQDWAKDNNLLVPPIYLVVKVIKHLIFCKAKGTLIVPRWVSAPYWTLIFHKNLQYPFYVKEVLEFTESERIYVKGSNPKCVFGSESFLSTVLAVRLDASL